MRTITFFFILSFFYNTTSYALVCSLLFGKIKSASSIETEDRSTKTDITVREKDEFKRLLPHLNLEYALEVPWEETIRDPLLQPQPQNSALSFYGSFGSKEMQKNYLHNQQELRIAFLRLIKDISHGNFTRDMLRQRLSVMNRILFLGTDGSTPYYPETAPTLDLQEFAGAFSSNGSSLLGDYFIGSLLQQLETFIDIKVITYPLRKLILLISEFYKTALQSRYIFVRGNHALFMNFCNGLLRLYGLHGIEHGQLDWDSVHLSKDQFFSIFLEKVKNANPQVDFQLRKQIHRKTYELDITNGPKSFPNNLSNFLENLKLTSRQLEKLEHQRLNEIEYMLGLGQISREISQDRENCENLVIVLKEIQLWINQFLKNIDQGIYKNKPYVLKLLQQRIREQKNKIQFLLEHHKLTGHVQQQPNFYRFEEGFVKDLLISFQNLDFFLEGLF